MGYFDHTPETGIKVYLELEEETSYYMTRISHRHFGGPSTYRETQEIVGSGLERFMGF